MYRVGAHFGFLWGALGVAAEQNHPSEKTSQEDATAATPGADAENAHSAASMLPNGVGFSYGFPTLGSYPIFVQVKHGEMIETGVFDACVN